MKQEELTLCLLQSDFRNQDLDFWIKTECIFMGDAEKTGSLIVKRDRLVFKQNPPLFLNIKAEFQEKPTMCIIDYLDIIDVKILVFDSMTKNKSGDGHMCETECDRQHDFHIELKLSAVNGVGFRKKEE